MFVVLRPASNDDRRESVDFGEVHLFVGPQFVITVRHDAVPDLSTDRDALEAEPQFLAKGPRRCSRRSSTSSSTATRPSSPG